jgi:hypothetical protein
MLTSQAAWGRNFFVAAALMPLRLGHHTTSIFFATIAVLINLSNSSFPALL